MVVKLRKVAVLPKDPVLNAVIRKKTYKKKWHDEYPYCKSMLRPLLLNPGRLLESMVQARAYRSPGTDDFGLPAAHCRGWREIPFIGQSLRKLSPNFSCWTLFIFTFSWIWHWVLSGTTLISLNCHSRSQSPGMLGLQIRRDSRFLDFLDSIHSITCTTIPPSFELFWIRIVSATHPLPPPNPRTHTQWMWCCRSGWPGLCLFCCYQPSCAASHRVDFGLFFLFKFSN